MVYFQLAGSDFVIEVLEADRDLHDSLLTYEEITVDEYNSVNDRVDQARQDILSNVVLQTERKDRLQVKYDAGELFPGDSQTFEDTYGFNPA